MSKIQTPHEFKCDLAKGPVEVNLPTPLMHQDALGDVFRVSVWKGGSPIDLTGVTATGYLYIAATQQTLLLNGAVSGSSASVTLEAGCYAMPGHASLVIQLQQGDVRHTVLKVNFVITRTGTENVVLPEMAGPSLPEMLAKIAAMEDATKAAKEAAATAQEGWDKVNDLADQLIQKEQLKPEYATSIEECTDTSKLYVLPDNYIYAYMKTTTEGETVPNFTNLMDNPNAYIKDGYRYSNSSAAFKECSTDCAIVVPINADPGAALTLRVRGASDGAAYKSSFYFGSTNQSFPNAQSGNAPVFTTESNGDLKITVSKSAVSGMNYGVFHVAAGVDEDSLIVTLNEPITYTTTEGGVEYRWASTGHAFVPADYEDEINALKTSSAKHGKKITELEQKVENINADESKEAAYARIKGWDAPVYDDAPVFLLDTPKAALNANTISSQPVAGIYAAYDALMAANPHHITREDCGLASDGATHIYAYHFKTPVTRDNQGNTAAEQKPVILACSGVHPLEQAGVYSLYNAMEEITTNPKLGDLRRNVHFVVVPMLNPTAVSDTQYHMRNPEGIQVHYNFEVEHGSNGAVQGDQTYGGATPLSTPEAQYFDALMARYQDNLACVLSCHNFGQDNARGAGYIWWSCGTTFMVNLGIRFCEKMSDAWHAKYGDAFTQGVRWANNYAVANWGGTAQPAWDMRIGWANLSGSGGSEYRQAIKYGVHGVNVEVCPLCMVLDKDATAYYSSNAMTWGCETYVNFIRTYMAWYDLMRKKDYAPNLPWVE